MNIFRLSVGSVLFFAALVSGCGGGDSASSGPYGSIAVSTGRADVGISNNYKTQSDADFRALSDCGSTCVLAARFEGVGQCGVASFSVNGSGGIIGTGIGTKADAEIAALRSCQSKGGAYCELWKYNCNG